MYFIGKVKTLVGHGCVVFCLVLGVSSVQAAQVTLAWNASSSAGVTGYKIYVGTASRNYTITVDAGSQLTAIVPDLEVGVTYYFAATAYNATAESDFSEELVHTVVTDNDVIDAPTGVGSN